MGGRAGSEHDSDTGSWDAAGGRNPGARRPTATGRARIVAPPRRGLDLTAWLALAQQGDEDAFRAIYREVQPGLLRYVRALVGEDGEDVASEAWTQIARDIGSFSGDGDGFRGWAATIARHRAMDHLRRQRRRPTHAVTADELADLTATDDTAALALDAVSTDAAVAMIAALPRDQAEAVLLRVVMGLDATTAGRVLGKRAGAVRTAAHRGLRRLAEQLGPDPAAAEPGPNGARPRPRGDGAKRRDGLDQDGRAGDG